MYQQVFSEEIKNARIEHLANVRTTMSAQKGTRKKSSSHLLEDHHPVVWSGTRQRRKDEIQYCSFIIDGQICGAVTVWHGWLTGHTGAHGHYGKGSEQ
ncbi:MAG: hypothetical protein ACRDF4_08705 [Rhabdochlamydiaceae bacterium]